MPALRRRARTRNKAASHDASAGRRPRSGELARASSLRKPRRIVITAPRLLRRSRTHMRPHATSIRARSSAARGLHVSRNGRTIISDIDIDIRPREIVTLIGPNGSGKTTLVRALLGLEQLGRRHHPPRSPACQDRLRAAALRPRSGAADDGRALPRARQRRAERAASASVLAEVGASRVRQTSR